MTDTTEETGNALIVAEVTNAVAVFGTAGGSKTVIDSIKAQVAKLDLDISTEAGRKKIKSVVRTLGTKKRELDDAGKALKADMQKTVDLVDGERKDIRDAIEAMQEEIKKPLEEFEQREKDRIAAREDRIKAMQELSRFDAGTVLAVEIFDERIITLKSLWQFDWMEFHMRAEKTCDDTLMLLKGARATFILEQQEAAKVEAERIERETKEREEREAKIAAEAAEKAKKDAEDKAAEDARIAKEKADREKREAEERVENERKAKEKAEQDAKDAEDRRIAAEKKAEDDRIAAAKKAEEDKKAAAEKAAQDERDRQAAAQKKKDDEEKARQADEAHRGKINRDVLAAVMQHANIGEGIGKLIVTALAKGLIPHTKIQY